VYFTDRRVRMRMGLAGLSLMAGCASPPPEPPATEARGVPRSTVTAVAATLPPPGPVRNWAEVRLQAAKRLVAANPSGTYMGEVPEPLLGIPVLEVELNADGSVRRILVLRYPQEARDVAKLAEAAVMRAAPFGDVSKLPKPWRFTETFLFDHDRKFKPRTLDR
jgi:hypothetical protein